MLKDIGKIVADKIKEYILPELTILKTKVEAIEGEVKTIKEKTTGLEYKFEGLRSEFQGLRDKVDALNAKDEIIKYLLEQWRKQDKQNEGNQNSKRNKKK
jgi:predicted nuclease with TOPRIM domain